MRNVTLIDYGVGNLLSLKMSLEFLGAKVIISKDKNEIINSSHIILPGVGAFSKAMKKIKDLELDKFLLDAKNKGSNILGICLGMQILMSESEEFGITKGLNFIEGKVVSISNSKNFKDHIKIPNIGWFNIHQKENIKIQTPIFNGLNSKDTFYFVHSFMGISSKKENYLYFANYSGIEIPAIIMDKNVIGCQFHPEKSGKSGLKLLKIFLTL